MIVYCHLMSWVGSSVVFAEHYYAWLQCNKQRYDLVHTLTVSEAARMNRREPDSNYAAGNKSSQFFSEERLTKEAVSQYKKIFPGATLLVYGDPVTHEPQPILDGPEDVKTAINKLAAEAADIGWWELDEKAMQIIQDKWRAIWDTLELAI